MYYMYEKEREVMFAVEKERKRRKKLIPIQRAQTHRYIHTVPT